MIKATTLCTKVKLLKRTSNSKTMDLKTINKWIKRWKEAKVFEANPDKRKKFFVNAPYPYVNGYLHLGHFYTYMRTEAFARYKRLRGYNVLYPQAWHATGTPITNAAERIKNKEEKQWSIMRQMGFSDKEIEKFADPEHWIRYFPKEAQKDLEIMGFSIDFRRQFITTHLNPRYDKFIRWQFNKLKEKGYVIKGKFPVVWDPKNNTPVGDHDRIEGEGEVPQEFILVKHYLDDNRILISATLRQDTILGITNLYLNPETSYKEIEIETSKGKENWILGEAAVRRLKEQGWKIKETGEIKGIDLIGKKTKEFGGRKVLILPATFLDPEFGTGLVHSVPSESADDLIALWDLQKDEKTCKKYGLDINEVKSIKPIPVLDTPGYGKMAAEKMLRDNNVNSQNERKKLDKIRKELYKLSFYEATFNEKYKKGFSKNLYGKKVSEGKEVIKKDLLEQGWIEIYYQLTGRVVSRALSECVVKIVDNQWFINYSDQAWKKKTRKALDRLNLYPEKARQQFNYVLDWLHEWACAREKGLGTNLPWDESWIIESLSDSTIYPAYYTIAHIVEKMPVEELTNEFFDFVFLGKGKGKKEWKRLQDEFNYWYPFDFRNSGKDLIQNHLAFCLFNHTAIFPEKFWPKGFGCNGHVQVDGQKMSKSLGNFMLLRELPEKFGVDESRLAILLGGEELDDPNFESELAKSLKVKLNSFKEFCIDKYNKGTMERRHIDNWMVSQLNSVIKETENYMDKTLFRSALQKCFFELNNHVKWYLRRSVKPNKEVISRVIEAQLIILSPFCPFLAEETWEKIGKKNLICTERWPSHGKIDEELNKSEKIIWQVLNDIHHVKKLAKVEKLKKVKLIIADTWKYDFVNKVVKEFSKTKNIGEIIKILMKDEGLRKHGREISRMVPRIAGKVSKVIKRKTEMEVIEEARDFLSKEFDCKIEIVEESKSSESKAKQAMPGKPAIVVV